PIHVIPNGIDVSAYARFAGAGDEATVIWLRAFHEVYQPELMPQVLRLLHDRGARLRLHMIGPDKGDGSLARTRARAEALGVSSFVTFTSGVAKAKVAE